LGKLLTSAFVAKQCFFGTGQGVVMPCGWGGNRRSGVALTLCQRLQWFVYLRAHGLTNEQPAYTHHGVWPGVKLGGGIPPDLRSATSYLRSITSNNRSCTSQLSSGTFLLGSTTLLGRIQASTLLKCHKSQTECLECSKTPGQRSGTPPLLSAVRTPALALKPRAYRDPPPLAE